MGEGCIFCMIVKGRLPSYKVYEDDDILVILDKYPASKGHLLVLTKEHYSSIHDAEPRRAVKALAVAAALARIYRESVGAPGVKLVVNSGRPAGQEIFHLHIHVIPYWPMPRRVPRSALEPGEAEEVISMLSQHVGRIKDYLAEAGLR